MTSGPDQDFGHAGMDGVPVVFLSGMLADQRMWEPAIAAYGRVEMDGKPAIRPVHFDLFDQDSVAAMARAVLDVAPDRFALVGMSMGGYVAFEILRQAAARVSHLMLVNTRATADTEAVKRRRVLLARLAGRAQRFVGINDTLLDEMIHPDNRSNDALIRLLGDMAEQAGAEVFLRQSIAVAHRPDSQGTLARIDIPSCVMSGEADQVISPESHRDMANRIAGANYHEVAGAGHYAPLERPEIFARALVDLLLR
ncbi:alpha/beta hydrolase [uncultured Thalassospira sp.]|uniref:alpha/beta fold hydrolase n=1 Tax=uncultured Thalassospira sp. TaxID=404382 RepID=UPI0025973C48|nr:alpha/beta hydrolase [uncultured Thalassospira sp.]